MNNVPKHLNQKILENERKEIDQQVTYWANQLKKAQSELEYWTRHRDALNIVHSRYLFDDLVNNNG